MPTVKVTSRAIYDPNDPYNTDYYRPNAASATKTDTPIMETPLAIQVIPKAVMHDQQAIQVGDAIKNVSGVFQGFTFGGFGEEFMIRGFNTNYANYLDGFRWPVSRMPLANAERIEVVKGAAANLYGRITPGGMINVVTKRPQATPYYSLEQRFGSYDLYQTLADATGAINQDGSLMYRINFEYLDKNSFRDFAYTDRKFVAPSFTWKVSDRTQFDLDFIYSNENTLEDHGVVASNTTRRPIDIPISRYLGEPAIDKSNTEIYSTAITLNHEFSDAWKINARFNYQSRDAIDLQHAAPGVINEATGELRRVFCCGDSYSDSFGGTVNINGKFVTWGLKHNVLAGWDYYGTEGTLSGWFLRPAVFGGPVNTINIYQPQYSLSGVNLSATPKNSFQDTSVSWNGVYFQDQITLFDKLHILGGGRYDWANQGNGSSNVSVAEASAKFSDIENQKFSPRVGILYQAWDWLSIYGNFVESLGAANTGIGAGGSVLQPETAEQFEAGFKTEFFDKRLISSLSYYHLTKQNMSVPIAGTPFSQTIGEARSQGIEVDISGQVTDGLNLIASYAYTDAVILKGNNAGNRLWNVPRNAGSFWAKYDLQQEPLRGLSVGAGVYFQDQREGDQGNSFELPGYGRVDALVKYQLPIAKAKTTLQFNVENLLDHQYYAATSNSNTFITPGAPRTFIGSVKVEF
jgi:iron complex outermembrane receptor protein